MKPEFINGGKHIDNRGTILYNNDFDCSCIKRLYIIENSDAQLVRGWQGHKIEQRWFTVMQGSFKINLIAIDDWVNPSKNLNIYSFIIKAEKIDVLHVPKGFVSSIQSMAAGSKLLVMSDYKLNEINDEYRFPLDYFELKEI